MAVAGAKKSAGLLSIGQVLARLTPDFPDLTPSKLRFLEEQGLIEPDRTPSGYRKFSGSDVERLRFILTMQRDHYLPLKVILGHLEELDAGRTPAIPGPNISVVAPSILSAKRRLDRDELSAATGASKQLLTEAMSAQLIPSGEYFDDDAVTIVSALVELERYGIEPRHLRGMRAAADREASLIELAVRPVHAKPGSANAVRAREATRELADNLATIREKIGAQAIRALSR
ncbi:MerR family transcriptional regulator [Humidisolicoccus flavus]|uniref:transcriptional regulator FtsR n=1 Tax=Humidisolicoccus flavus TaxID=3111414 RepID=UPI003254F0A3